MPKLRSSYLSYCLLLIACALLNACAALHNTAPQAAHALQIFDGDTDKNSTDTHLRDKSAAPLAETLSGATPVPAPDTVNAATTDISANIAANAIPTANDSAETPSTPFSAATLESLLTAELAAQRQRPDITLSLYLEQAILTRDQAVAARATTIAQILNQPQSLELAQLWAEIAPKSADAWYLVALNSMRQLRYDIAIPALDKLLVLLPDLDMEQFFLALTPNTQPARDVLFEQITALSLHHPNNAQLQFARALLKQQSQQPAAALSIANSARLQRPHSSQIVLLEAKVLTELNRNQDAAKLLADTLKEQPDNHNLRLNYGRALIRAGDMKGAQREFQTLVRKVPGDSNLHLSLALLAFDNRDDEVALHELAAINQNDEQRSTAQYYVGLIAQRQGRTAEALAAFEQVQTGNQYLPALAEAVRVLAQQKQMDLALRRLASARLQYPDLQTPIYQLEAELLSRNGRAQDAWNLLNTVLQTQPENTVLLLSRGMVAEQLNKLDDFEADLREVLRYEPENPSALNALGYTLVDRTPRVDEGAPYILRAYALKPDDPSIIDSVAWLKFRRGDNAGALADLRRAYAIYPDDEIAAHLGEVLWAMGAQSEARRTWAAALKLHPDSTHIAPTQQRLDPP